jgi:RND family efflux transporter MFP subunit
LKKALWIGLPVLVLLCLVAWRFVSNQKAAAALNQQQGQRRGGSAPVEVATAGPKMLVVGIETVGSAESPLKVQISPKVSGRIEWLEAREGDAVKAGELLARIDPSEQQALVLQAQANLAEARSRLAEAQLGRGPTEVSVESVIEQRKADLGAAKAELTQAQRNYDALVASAGADVTDAEAKVRAANSQVNNARAQLGKERASLKNAKAKLDRAKALLEEGFSSQQAVDDAQTAYDTQLAAVDVATGLVSSAQSAAESAEAQLKASQNQANITKQKGIADIAAAKARVTSTNAALTSATANRAETPAYRQNLAALSASVQAAQAQLDQARTRLNDLGLRSSINGTVTERNADPGSVASAGQVLLVVQSLEWLYVVGSLPLEDAAKVHVGQEADMTFDAMPNREFTGKITQVNPAGDPQSRQFTIRIRLENPDRSIRPGMFARVSVVSQRVDARVVIPKTALNAGDKATVTVVKEGKAEVRDVKVGLTQGNDVEILSGVAAGDQVVTLTFQPLKNGQEVKLPGAGKKEGKP